MIFNKKKSKPHLTVHISLESKTNTINPCRGWYQIFPFTFPQDVDFSYLSTCLLPDQSLVLVQLNLKNYKYGPLDNQAVKQIKEILDFFRNANKDIILRPLYDLEGKCLENEPTLQSIIKEHMQQIGTLLMDYENTIFSLQGLFVGNWGEMHGSRFLKGEGLNELCYALYEATLGKFRLCVRKPSQLRSLQYGCMNKGKSSIMDVMGLYNDAIFGSDTDLGTYAVAMSTDEAIAATESWPRNKELQFQKERCLFVPNGGEVLLNSSGSSLGLDCGQVIETLKQMHISYLNSQHDIALLTKWKSIAYTGKKDIFQGISLYDYVSAHLGYRFVLKEATLVKNNLRITFDNTGFAPIYTPYSVQLIAKPVNSAADSLNISKRIGTKGDANPYTQSFQYTFDIHGLTIGTYDLSIQLIQKDGRIVHFSNENAGESLFIGQLSI
jgi:hypothetical protein